MAGNRSRPLFKPQRVILLADALVRAKRERVRTMFHVHDEIVAEVRDDGEAAALTQLMKEAPS